MEKQNGRQICKNNMEFQSAVPPPRHPPEGDEDGPSLQQQAHQSIYVNQKADLIDPQIFPYPDQNFDIAKDFIISKGELKYYVDQCNRVMPHVC